MTVRNASYYAPDVTAASKSVLIELWTTLSAYRDSMVLVGGWVPYFLIELFGSKEGAEQHVGSIDIDVALDHRGISDREYASIRELLERRGYTQKLDRLDQPIPFIFERTVRVDQRISRIEVDFLSAAEGGSGPGHRNQRIQRDLLARKARGCDIAFGQAVQYRLDGLLPDGSLNRVRVQVAGITACLTMKGIVLGERYKEKDAYDVYMVVKHCLGGPAGVAREVAASMGHPLVREAMALLAEKFRTSGSVGSRWAAEFIGGEDALLERTALDAHMNVWEFLRCLDQQIPERQRVTEPAV